ncbi:LysR family transcriptional regulator [Phyllobacterium sophorae]|uniref:LysR family transcriptional regulator n=1 Tax=Phyllobacterium sophorae TaxID=1520277 RepID=UPI001FE1EFDA|nr:LysR family transcriptional regulator [Phyllobacterium sophorae]
MTGSDMPPLTALRAFEATARLSSFKAAAAELFVTPTAISHQIRQLEEYLGLRVLDRTPRSVKLTSKGKELYEATVSGFGEIRRSVTRLREFENPKALTLSATTAFLSHWLVPRLAEIRRVLPELDLRLHASETMVKLQPGEIDVAIRYGKGPFAGVEATPLKIDVFAPVCSPGLNMMNPEDIHRVALIHVDGRTSPLPLPDWPRWCAEAGISGVNTTAGLGFPTACTPCRRPSPDRAWRLSVWYWRQTPSPRACWSSLSVTSCPATSTISSARLPSAAAPTSKRYANGSGSNWTPRVLRPQHARQSCKRRHRTTL